MSETTNDKKDAPNSMENAKVPPKNGIVNFVDGFGDSVEILCDERLPEYDSGPALAYRARNKDGGAAEFFALVCEKHLTPRTTAAHIYQNISNGAIMPLISRGVAYWTPVKQERFIFLYRQISGKRIHQVGEEMALSWRQETVMETMVKPMAEMLRDFRDSSFFHGGIRPSNMFAANSTGKIENIVLGDCLALPPSYLQPVLFEPIERAMSQPVARGEGTAADDLYAFGVSLAVILRAHDPLLGMTDYEIIREKMEHGSYAAITGKDRFKGSILELLRGLLHDDAKERWTIDEVMTWLDGRRLSPKQSLKLKKAARPMTYDGRKYLYAAMLAMDVDSNPTETVRMIDSGDFDQWLERSLEDEEVLERVAVAVKTAREKGTGPGYEERLSANLSIALDPMAPIRYKGLRLMGDGIGSALTESIVLRQDIQRFVELFSQGLAFTWLTSSKNTSMDSGSLISRFDQCRNFIRHGKPGYGVERCIYTLSPESPCFSEKLKDYYVTSPEDMMRTFEDLCKKGNAPAMFLDRHCMAFLSIKDPKVLDPFLFELSSMEEHRRILGNLKCLGSIQKRSNLPMYPGIAKVFIDALPSVYARYHDREVREKLEAAAKKYAAEGDLNKMSMLFSNNEVIAKDMMSFRMSMKEYAELEREYAHLTSKLEDRNNFGKATGKELAAIVSSAIASVVILSAAFLLLSGHGGFTP